MQDTVPLISAIIALKVKVIKAYKHVFSISDVDVADRYMQRKL